LKILTVTETGDPHIEWEGDLMWVCLAEGANPPTPEDGLEWQDFQGFTVHQIL
jgi:hypothetical protein